jgi:hypothetical protein
MLTVPNNSNLPLESNLTVSLDASNAPLEKYVSDKFPSKEVEGGLHRWSDKYKQESSVRTYLAYFSTLFFIISLASCYMLPESLIEDVIAPMVCIFGVIVSFYFKKK